MKGQVGMRAGFQTIMSTLILGVTLGVPAYAQVMPDPAVLVSAPRASLYNAPRQSGQSSVVRIKAVDAPTLHTENGRTGMGSDQRDGQGIIIDPSGIILTNTHVIGSHPQRIFVTLADGKTLEARPVYAGRVDFSFIKIEANYPLKAMAWGDSTQVHVGNPVVALANLNASTQGALGGQVTSLVKEETTGLEMFELNLPLKHGDSGGPILDQQGCLVGLITANSKTDARTSYAIVANNIQQEYFKYKGSVLN